VEGVFLAVTDALLLLRPIRQPSADRGSHQNPFQHTFRWTLLPFHQSNRWRKALRVLGELRSCSASSPVAPVTTLGTTAAWSARCCVVTEKFWLRLQATTRTPDRYGFPCLQAGDNGALRCCWLGGIPSWVLHPGVKPPTVAEFPLNLCASVK